MAAVATRSAHSVTADLTDDGVMDALREAHKQDYRRFFELGPKEGDDESSLDYRLALQLSRMVGREPKRIERLMRRSRFVREKWDERRGGSTYLHETINNALRDAQLTPPKGDRIEGVPIASPYQSTEIATTSQDGSELFAELYRHLGRYVRMGEHEKVFLTLWILHTHALDAAEQTPYVHVSSPAAACGKSTLITVLQGLVNKGVRVVNASTSFLFRVLDADAPTLLVDEVHRWLRGDSKGELHALLHDGYHRGGQVGRIREVRGEGTTTIHVPTYYKTWGAKLFAGIGSDLTAELMSRCVPVRLVRASSAEQDALVKVRARPYAKVSGRFRGRCARWVLDNLAALKRARPSIPRSLDGRQQDVWEPLFAIADLMDAKVGARSREAAVALHHDRPRDLGEELLHDLLVIFARRPKSSADAKPRAFRTTLSLLRALWAMTERTWNEMPYTHKPLTSHELARLLKRFDIEPVRPKHSGPRGYSLKVFLPAWRRYLTDNGSKKLIGRLRPRPAQVARAADGMTGVGRLGHSGRILLRRAKKSERMRRG